MLNGEQSDEKIPPGSLAEPLAIAMNRDPHLVVCPDCNSLYRYRRLADHEHAQCERCLATLYHSHDVNTAYLLALASAATLFFIVGNVTPVIAVSFHGIHHEMRLWQSVGALAEGTIGLMSISVFVLLIAAPLLHIALLLWILLFAHGQRRAPGFAGSMKMVVWLRHWCIVDVGVLGLLVTAIKLSDLMEVTLGVGGGCLLAALLLMVIISQHDLRPLWSALPPSPTRHHPA